MSAVAVSPITTYFRGSLVVDWVGGGYRRVRQDA